jgi:hypothetical protein
MRMMREKSKRELVDMMMKLQGLLEEKKDQESEEDEGYYSEVDERK